MLRFKKLQWGAFLLIASLYTTFANAGAVTYTFDGSWDTAYNGDLGAGYTIDVTFDNNGSAVANQSFTSTDFVSISILSGNFDFTFTQSHLDFFQDLGFQSNSDGRLFSGYLYVEDSSGAAIEFNLAPDSAYAADTGSGTGYYMDTVISNAGVTTVPAPMALVLFASGLAGLGFTRKKKVA